MDFKFPSAKFSNRLETLPQGEQGYMFIIMGGSFSPIHKSHLKCMEAAKERCEAEGYAVLGGLLVPSTDRHVMYKLGDEGLKKEVRNKLCQDCVEDSDWIDVLTSEKNYADTRMVRWNLTNALPEVLDICPDDITVYELYGSDIVSTSSEKLLVVVRDPSHAQHLQEAIDSGMANPGFYLISDPSIEPFSSTAARLAVQNRDVVALRTMLPHKVLLELYPWAV
eukprot:TRINITY_DN1325_c0_g1_i1.p1 TRINITY_DN1325_c0_g1~~TRINITY_DN1325_c0_g1_i1.p1  ORF type:complete len:244 (+),score=40.31 TRINITY_DN1325_c0_g1_i1:64-732(+)